MSKNIGKNMNKNVNGNYGQKLLNDAKLSVTDARKTASKRPNQKTAESTGDLIGNKTADKTTKVSRTSPQSDWKIVTNKVENIGVIDKYLKKDISPQEKDRKLSMTKTDIIIVQQWNTKK